MLDLYQRAPAIVLELKVMIEEARTQRQPQHFHRIANRWARLSGQFDTGMVADRPYNLPDWRIHRIVDRAFLSLQLPTVRVHG
jgi:hypothetical protein